MSEIQYILVSQGEIHSRVDSHGIDILDYQVSYNWAASFFSSSSIRLAISLIVISICLFALLAADVRNILIINKIDNMIPAPRILIWSPVIPDKAGN